MNDINKDLLFAGFMWLGGLLLGLSFSWDSRADISKQRYNQQVNQCLQVVGGAVYDTPTAEQTFKWCMNKYK
jgi:hypothetical protein